MRIEEATANPPCGNPACGGKLSIKLVDLKHGAEVTCGGCGSVTVLNVRSEGEPADPGATLRRLKNSLDAVGARYVPTAAENVGLDSHLRKVLGEIRAFASIASSFATSETKSAESLASLRAHVSSDRLLLAEGPEGAARDVGTSVLDAINGLLRGTETKADVQAALQLIAHEVARLTALVDAHPETVT